MNRTTLLALRNVMAKNSGTSAGVIKSWLKRHHGRRPGETNYEHHVRINHQYIKLAEKADIEDEKPKTPANQHCAPRIFCHLRHTVPTPPTMSS